jgi:hypothetical protein
MNEVNDVVRHYSKIMPNCFNLCDRMIAATEESELRWKGMVGC